MRIGALINYSGDFLQAADEAIKWTHSGLDLLAIPEAYAFDAPSQLGYLAAQAPGIELTTSVIPIYTRTPTLIGMTAATLDYLSQGHFSLGLGASGPQVIEGFHGTVYDAPLARTREIVDICRKVWTGEKVAYDGVHYSLPLAAGRGTGLGKSLGLISKPHRPDIPILLAALGPKNVELTAEIAEGWQPMFFAPERFRTIWGDALDQGVERRADSLGALDIHAQIPLALGGPGSSGYEAIRRHYALYIGGMGAPERNFYYRIACAYGFEAAAAQIQQLFLGGHKQKAAGAVPHELVSMTALVGDASDMHAHIQRLANAGVGTIYLIPFDEEPQSRAQAVTTVLNARL